VTDDVRRYEPVEQVRCHGCGSIDVLRMPIQTIFDQFRWSFQQAPFKCRSCRKKLYRQVKRKSN
jgi:hypothetical protein